jgi:hypothetical protein
MLNQPALPLCCRRPAAVQRAALSAPEPSSHESLNMPDCEPVYVHLHVYNVLLLRKYIS